MNTVSTSALIRRINRRLAPEWEAVRKCSARSRSHQALGDFYRLNIYQNTITAAGVDPIEIARQLGVLGEWERVEGGAR